MVKNAPSFVVRDRARFFEKNIFAQRIGKIDQKWVKNRVF